MKSEWADYAAVQALSGNLSGNKLTRSLSGSTPSQSSQLAEPLWTDPGINSGISVHELISTLKKKKAQVGIEWSNILPQILVSEENATKVTTAGLGSVCSTRSTILLCYCYVYYDIILSFLKICIIHMFVLNCSRL